MPKIINGTLLQKKIEAEQMTSLKYELMGFCALVFLLVVLFTLPSGKDARENLRTPADIILANQMLYPR